VTRQAEKGGEAREGGHLLLAAKNHLLPNDNWDQPYAIEKLSTASETRQASPKPNGVSPSINKMRTENRKVSNFLQKLPSIEGGKDCPQTWNVTLILTQRRQSEDTLLTQT